MHKISKKNSRTKKHYYSTINPSVKVEKTTKSNLPLLITILIIISSGSLYLYLKTSYPFLFTSLSNPESTTNDMLSNPSLEISPSPTPKPTHSPYPLIPDTGTAGTYSVSQSHKVGPLFTRIVVDPLDAKPNDRVTVIVTLKSDTEIISITGELKTDTNPITFNLSKLSREGNIETWTTTYSLTEPVLYNYIILLNAKDQSNNINYSLPLRKDQ